MPDYKSRLKKSLQKEKSNLPSEPIPPSAALIKLGEHAKESSYRLNFKYYNHKQCELDKVDNFKPLIDKFNYMTQSNNQTFRSRGRVHNSGDYANLFTGLPPDADLEELEFANPGRIIFFRIANYICLVAVLVNHRRT